MLVDMKKIYIVVKSSGINRENFFKCELQTENENQKSENSPINKGLR